MAHLAHTLDRNGTAIWVDAVVRIYGDKSLTPAPYRVFAIAEEEDAVYGILGLMPLGETLDQPEAIHPLWLEAADVVLVDSVSGLAASSESSVRA